MGNFNVTGINQLAFTETNMTITDDPSGLRLSVPDSNDTIDLTVNSRTFSVRDGLIDASTNTMDFTERGAPAGTANQAKIYSKDVSTVTHMFVIDSAGIETDLTTGGTSFADDTFDIHDNVTPTKILQFTLTSM